MEEAVAVPRGARRSGRAASLHVHQKNDWNRAGRMARTRRGGEGDRRSEGVARSRGREGRTEMTMEAQRVACRDALNMASTGRLKNVDYKDDDRKERLKKLIRDNVRPVQVRSAFDVVAMLAPLDTERLKLIAD